MDKTKRLKGITMKSFVLTLNFFNKTTFLSTVPKVYQIVLKITNGTLASVVKCLECRPMNQRGAGLLPSQGHVPRLPAYFPLPIGVHVGGNQSSKLLHWLSLLHNCYSITNLMN